MKFKVGDKVCYKHKDDTDNVEVGEVGIIRGVSSRGKYAVDFETKDTFKHDCDGYCRDNYGWWCAERTLEPAHTDGGIVTVHDALTHEIWTTPFVISKDKLDALVDAWAKLGCTTFNLVPDEVKEVIKKTEEKKMPTKFTFYTIEGYRINKSNNTQIPTITTEVYLYGSGTTGSATCDKADYDERQGVVEALANAAIGNFEREYRRAVQQKKVDEKNARTCSYCGEVFDTVSEKDAHEAWHVERRKARRERYLLRKRAKEIAFEEAAQKLAKEMTGDKK